MAIQKKIASMIETGYKGAEKNSCPSPHPLSTGKSRSRKK
jgi:hypothetical protein